MSEQRRPYRSRRPWLEFTFLTPDGIRADVNLVADTGCSFDFILCPELYDILVRADLGIVPRTNFGDLPSGMVLMYMPEVGFVESVRALRSDLVGALLEREHPTFAGVVGLPILRLGEYGGNASEFWFRYPTPNTPSP